MGLGAHSTGSVSTSVRAVADCAHRFTRRPLYDADRALDLASDAPSGQLTPPYDADRAVDLASGTPIGHSPAALEMAGPRICLAES